MESVFASTTERVMTSVDRLADGTARQIKDKTEAADFQTRMHAQTREMLKKQFNWEAIQPQFVQSYDGHLLHAGTQGIGRLLQLSHWPEARRQAAGTLRPHRQGQSGEDATSHAADHRHGARGVGEGPRWRRTWTRRSPGAVPRPARAACRPRQASRHRPRRPPASSPPRPRRPPDWCHRLTPSGRCQPHPRGEPGPKEHALSVTKPL